MKNLIYIPIAFALILALSSFTTNINSSPSNPHMSIEKDTSIIQSYIFHIQKTPFNLPSDILDPQIDFIKEKGYFYSFELKNMIETSGYLKPKSGFANHQHNEEEFFVVFFNSNKEEIYSTTIANPLIKHFEVADEDGSLKRERVEVDEEVIMIRTNKLVDFLYCEVYLVENEKKGQLIGGSTYIEEDPCEEENTAYIVAINSTKGINAETIKCYINGEYIGEIPPGGESPRIMLPAGKVYEVIGKTPSGAVQIKDIDLAKCEEVGVRLLYKE